MLKEKNCCYSINNSKKGILKGLFFGLIPHSFCIAFIIFSIIGAVGATALTKKFLLIPYFFFFLVIISFLFAILSTVIYLKQIDCLCIIGIKEKWKYITSIFSMTIFTNIIIFFVIFPLTANMQTKGFEDLDNQFSVVSVEVDIPCSGHASLIISEIKKELGVNFVRFKLPSIFEINFDPKKTSLEKIESLEIFQIFKLKNN